MSSGHRHKGVSLGDHEVDLALVNPAVRKRLARAPQVSRSWDMAYLGGYSVDGRTVYLDRHLPQELEYRGRKISLDRFLILHEEVEKALIDALGFKYPHAHEIATRVEENAVRAARIDLGWYRKALEPMIKTDEHERLLRVPTNLDLTPYKAPPVDDGLMRHVQHAQLHPQGGRYIKPADAHYGPGHADSNCGVCAYFLKPHGCTVLGRARRDMWCEWFTHEYQPKEHEHA